MSFIKNMNDRKQYTFAAIAIGGAAIGVAGGIGKAVSRGKANKRLKALQNENVVNPLAKQRLGLANTLLNARMPSAASVERNIYQNQANTISNAQRAATSGNNLLLAGAGVQGQTNQAFNALGEDEANDYQRRYANEVAAQEGVMNEEQRVFGNKVQFQGAISANQQAGWGDISNMGFGIADFGLSNFRPKKVGSDGKFG